ncbi:hypothetical protein BDR03DRAFT_1001514 [Suillus americanus]|nr:hypothetical protein BDR03DRAFT_1001514 [Suillus americanus]
MSRYDLSQHISTPLFSLTLEHTVADTPLQHILKPPHHTHDPTTTRRGISVYRYWANHQNFTDATHRFVFVHKPRLALSPDYSHPSRAKPGDNDTRELLKLDYNKGIVVHLPPNLSISTYLTYNIDAVKEYVANTSDPRLIVTRSSDVSKPGVEDVGGQEVEIHLRIVDTQGFKSIFSKIVSLHAESNHLLFAVPGGLIDVETKIDLTLCRADRLVGQVLDVIGKHPKVYTGRHFRMYQEALVAYRASVSAANFAASLNCSITETLQNDLPVCVLAFEINDGVKEGVQAPADAPKNDLRVRVSIFDFWNSDQAPLDAPKHGFEGLS